MPITIPDVKKLRLTTGLTPSVNGGQLLPGVAAVAMASPGPVVLSTAGTSPAGQPQVLPAQEAQASKGVANYYGFNVEPQAAGEACQIVRGVIIEGFAGMTPASPIYIDSAAAGGLTHTAPNGVTQQIGVAITATRARFH